MPLYLSAKSQVCFVRGPGFAELLNDHASQARAHCTILSPLCLHALLEEQSKEAQGTITAGRLKSAVFPFPGQLVTLCSSQAVWG